MQLCDCVYWLVTWAEQKQAVIVKEEKVMKNNFILGMVAAVVLSMSWIAFVQASRAEQATSGPIKEYESLKGITVLMPDGSPAVSKNIMLIVDVNREVSEMDKFRPYGSISPSASKNIMVTTGVTRKVGEMEKLGPYGPLRSDEKGFLLLPEEVLRSSRKQNSLRKIQSFFPRLIMYGKPSDSTVFKGGGYFNSKDIYFGRPKSVKLIQGTLDKEEKKEFFIGVVKAVK
jgi:hypothetical protein